MDDTATHAETPKHRALRREDVVRTIRALEGEILVAETLRLAHAPSVLRSHLAHWQKVLARADLMHAQRGPMQ